MFECVFPRMQHRDPRLLTRASMSLVRISSSPPLPPLRRHTPLHGSESAHPLGGKKHGDRDSGSQIRPPLRQRTLFSLARAAAQWRAAAVLRTHAPSGRPHETAALPRTHGIVNPAFERPGGLSSIGLGRKGRAGEGFALVMASGVACDGRRSRDQRSWGGREMLLRHVPWDSVRRRRVTWAPSRGAEGSEFPGARRWWRHTGCELQNGSGMAARTGVLRHQDSWEARWGASHVVCPLNRRVTRGVGWGGREG